MIAGEIFAIVATGHAYPSLRVDHDEYLRRCEAPPAYDPRTIAEQARIATRAWCAPGETTLTLARQAVTRALSGRPELAAEIDLVIVASGTTIPVLHPADPARPGAADLAPFLVDDLGRAEVLGLDVKGCYCTGFLRGVQLASAMLRDPSYRAALVVATEQGSRLATAASNRSSFCFLMADAAGAAVVARRARTERAGIVDQIGWTDGAKRDWIAVGDDGRSMLVNGRHAAQATHELLVTLARRLLERNRMAAGDVQWLLPVQTHAGLVDGVCKELRWPAERVLWSAERTGFSGSASIPVCLAEQIESGRVRRGDLVLAAAVGAGLNGAGALFYA
jgi:3-oxoacyl-[acyl-carrier-protein] synthase-3